MNVHGESFWEHLSSKAPEYLTATFSLNQNLKLQTSSTVGGDCGQLCVNNHSYYVCSLSMWNKSCIVFYILFLISIITNQASTFISILPMKRLSGRPWNHSKVIQQVSDRTRNPIFSQTSESLQQYSHGGFLNIKLCSHLHNLLSPYTVTKSPCFPT